MGYRGYDAQAIYQYIRELTDKPFLKYLVFYNDNGSFYAITSAAKFIKRNPTLNRTYHQLAQALISNDKSLLESIIPDLITAKESLTVTTSRSDALRRMLDNHVDVLPVLDKNEQLQGVVSKASITGSLLLEIASKVEK
ncbi:CBS domain-containing protein [Pleionea mediterranea]|jgi:CBS-domain-containing membrane protein|uniref:CBS domain protein n=1 Tax=Pleionea mediterranea TaxID=523701 RepID=A0A316G0V0_9GAMM|nr:CBS domain-containing protein [Pleionea mediterranea]PWK54428.1 CBS domain protein [Pleionea mediterranea]